MIPQAYITALEEFVAVEVNLTLRHSGEEHGAKAREYYTAMYDYVSANPDKFILFQDSGVSFLESEFIERVRPIKEKLTVLTDRHHIPGCAIFIPSLKINNTYKHRIIQIQVAEFIRQIFDKEPDEQFSTLRQFRPVDRKGPLFKWLKSKNGKNFLFEYQVSEGLRKEVLLRKRLQLFDSDFTWVQMMYMSQKEWAHEVVVEAFGKWERNHKLWSNIDHLKRQLHVREIYDESRLEINFMRLLEENGYTGRFIHDESISWQLKFRPDFWFVKEGLIVEYDEKAHNWSEQDDIKREKIIKRHVPNVHFIRVKEGLEVEGLQAIKAYLARFDY